MPPGYDAALRDTLPISTRLAMRDVYSAGLGSPAQRQAGMPAATFQTGPNSEHTKGYAAGPRGTTVRALALSLAGCRPKLK